MVPAVSGSFVVIAMFAGPLIFSVGLPLVLTWRQVHAMESEGKPTPLRPGRYGDLWLHGAHEVRFLGALQVSARRHVAFHGARVACSIVAAGLLRRHLMAWKIFCPR
jgi:hypothetical protein